MENNSSRFERKIVELKARKEAELKSGKITMSRFEQKIADLRAKKEAQKNNNA